MSEGNYWATRPPCSDWKEPRVNSRQPGQKGGTQGERNKGMNDAASGSNDGNEFIQVVPRNASAVDPYASNHNTSAITGFNPFRIPAYGFGPNEMGDSNPLKGQEHRLHTKAYFVPGVGFYSNEAYYKEYSKCSRIPVLGYFGLVPFKRPPRPSLYSPFAGSNEDSETWYHANPVPPHLVSEIPLGEEWHEFQQIDRPQTDFQRPRPMPQYTASTTSDLRGVRVPNEIQ